MNPTTIATVRTGWNAGVLALVLALVRRVFGFEVSVELVELFAPVLAVVVAIFYRASRVLADRYPTLGYVLFGSPQSPTYPKGGE